MHFVYRCNLKSHAKLTTYEVNKPALSPVAMVTGAKPQAEYGFFCDDESGHCKQKSSAEEISEASAAALIEVRHYNSNTLVHLTTNNALSV